MNSEDKLKLIEDIVAEIENSNPIPLLIQKNPQLFFYLTQLKNALAS